MKLITVLVLCLPMVAFAAEHGGAPAEAMSTSTAPAAAQEHGGAPAESKDTAAAPAKTSEHGGAPAEAKP